jgi:hypothetical protein
MKKLFVNNISYFVKTFFALSVVLGLSACGTGLAGDIIPPPGYATEQFLAPGPVVVTPMDIPATELPTEPAIPPETSPTAEILPAAPEATRAEPAGPAETPAVPGTTPTLDISKVEVTSDTSGLVVERMHIILDFPTPDTMQVAELFIITNAENTMVVPVETGKPVLEFNLPPGATGLQFQDGDLGDRFVTTPNGFGDTLPIPPGGGHQVIFVYSLPYPGEQSLAFSPPLRVLQEVVMLPAGGVSLESQQLQDAGTRSMQAVQGSQESISLHLYAGGELPAGTPLEMKVTGFPSSQAGANSNGQVAPAVQGAIGLAVFGLALIGVGLYFYFQQPARRRAARTTGTVEAEEEEAEGVTRDELLDEIVALDDLYKDGKLPQDVYATRRSELIEKLKKVNEE